MGLRGTNHSKIDLSKAEEPWRDDSLSLAEQVIKFCEYIPCTSGLLAGKNFILQDWQKEIIRGLYKVDKDGKRVVRTGVLSFGRKNGKSSLAALLSLSALCGPTSESRGQVFSAASDRSQAGLIFNELVAAIEATPWLACRCNIQTFKKTITDFKTKSTYIALSSDARKAHGLSPSFVIADELAQWPKRDLWDNLVSGTGGREHPLCIAIGTQAASDTHFFSELIDYGAAVMKGDVDDPTFFASIWIAPKGCDIEDPSAWKAANPALDVFRSKEELSTAAIQAKRIPARWATFCNLYLNQRVDAAVHWIAREDWQACSDEYIDPSALYGKPCWAGLDLSSTCDLSALVLWFGPEIKATIPFFWLPDHNLAFRVTKDRVPYDEWARNGKIILTHGRAIDKESIAVQIAHIAELYDLRGIAYDRWRIADLTTQLDKAGIQLPLVGWGQGYASMSPAIEATEQAILNDEIRHDSPVLTWNVSNCVTTSDPAGNRKIDKARATARIDGAVAFVMAVGLYNRLTEDKPLVLSEENYRSIVL